MFVKTAFKKFNKFPCGVTGIYDKSLLHTELKTSVKQTSPSVYFLSDNSMRVFFSDFPISIELLLTPATLEELERFVNDLSGKQIDDFLIEYTVYSTLSLEQRSKTYDWATKPLLAIKQDVLDILKSYSVSEKLLERLEGFNILIPVALADIMGHIFYQIYALNDLTETYSVTFTGVDSTGFSRELKKAKSDIFPWKSPFYRDFYGEYDNLLNFIPLLWNNVLFGVNPAEFLPDSKTKNVTTVPVEQYLNNLLSLDPLTLTSRLGTALNYRAFLDELVPDSTLEKIKNGADLSETEKENFCKFLDITGAMFYGQNQEYMSKAFNYIGHNSHIRLLLQTLSLKEMTASKMPEKVLELAGCEAKPTNYQYRYFMSYSDLPKVVFYKNKIYVLGSGSLTVWGYQVSGIDWKQVKEKVLEGWYSYDS